MDRIHALTIYLPEPPTPEIMQVITDNGGEFSAFDAVTDLSNVCWFETLDEEVLLTLTEKAEVFSGLEQRYQVDSGEVDEDGNAIYQALTKENFADRKADMLSTEKVAAIQAARRPVDGKIGGMGKTPVEETIIK